MNIAWCQNSDSTRLNGEQINTTGLWQKFSWADYSKHGIYIFHHVISEPGFKLPAVKLFPQNQCIGAHIVVSRQRHYSKSLNIIIACYRRWVRSTTSFSRCWITCSQTASGGKTCHHVTTVMPDCCSSGSDGKCLCSNSVSPIVLTPNGLSVRLDSR